MSETCVLNLVYFSKMNMSLDLFIFHAIDRKTGK